jgi:hypothetical protein
VVWLCKEASFLNTVATLQKQNNCQGIRALFFHGLLIIENIILYDLTSCHLKMKSLTPYFCNYNMQGMWIPWKTKLIVCEDLWNLLTGLLADTQMEGYLWSYYTIYPCRGLTIVMEQEIDRMKQNFEWFHSLRSYQLVCTEMYECKYLSIQKY